MNESTPKDQLLSIIRQLEPEAQVDLVNEIYEEIYNDRRLTFQESQQKQKRATEVMERFRFKVSQSK
jgi:pyridoxine 5'-phosphate synthase PdxJ